VPEIKFCGLTRPVDAAHAVALGADYLGVVLAPSPRQVTIAAARRLFDPSVTTTRRVGVFVAPALDDLRRAVDELALDAVQLHGVGPAPLEDLRSALGAEVAVWGVAGVEGATVDAAAVTLARACDVLLFDSRIAGHTGGSGRAFDWTAARSTVDGLRGSARIALAGGLHPGNVAEAVLALSPDIVDVSSGIEASPGVKDPARMTAFAAAVRYLTPP
jgi:phosphoribosylanthranilate isomerase